MSTKMKLRHCYNLRPRLTVAMTSTSTGQDVSVGRQSCLVRLVGLLFSWVSLVYRSSVFAVGRSGRFGVSLILPGASCGSSSRLGVVGLPLLDVHVFSGRLVVVIIIIICVFLRNCSCPRQNIRTPKLGSHFLFSIPAVAQIRDTDSWFQGI
jgi:hypothetical protein